MQSKQHELVLRNFFEIDYPSFSSPRTYSERLYSHRPSNQDEYVLDNNAIHNINVSNKFINDFEFRRRIERKAFRERLRNPLRR